MKNQIHCLVETDEAFQSPVCEAKPDSYSLRRGPCFPFPKRHLRKTPLTSKVLTAEDVDKFKLPLQQKQMLLLEPLSYKLSMTLAGRSVR